MGLLLPLLLLLLLQMMMMMMMVVVAVVEVVVHCNDDNKTKIHNDNSIVVREFGLSISYSPVGFSPGTPVSSYMFKADPFP